MWHRHRHDDTAASEPRDRKSSERADFSGNADGGQGSEFVDCRDEVDGVGAAGAPENESGSAWLRARHWSPSD
jgi:hypothetical protein